MGWRVETQTRVSRVAGVAAVILIAVAVVLPAFAGRGLIQDLFFILTMLVLAQFWNLLAGYGGLVSVGSRLWVARQYAAGPYHQPADDGGAAGLGRDVEEEAYLFATEQDLMGENVFCESLAGEELGRMKSWGKHPLSRAEHYLSSPCHMNDLPQTFMEPLLFKTACSRGTQSRMSTEYVSHVQDADGVTATCRDRLTGKDITVRSTYLVGADGGNSLVAEHAGLPFEGKMGVGGSMNILFRADLSRYVAHRPSVLYWVMQPGADVGGIGMGLVRMVRPWNEWLIVGITSASRRRRWMRPSARVWRGSSSAIRSWRLS